MSPEQKKLVTTIKATGLPLDFIEPGTENSVAFRIRGRDWHVTIQPKADGYQVAGLHRHLASAYLSFIGLLDILMTLAREPWQINKWGFHEL